MDSIKYYFFCSIILEAAYSLNDRAFVDNLGTILLYAVLVGNIWHKNIQIFSHLFSIYFPHFLTQGTVMNIAIIGGLLILFDFAGLFGSFRIGVLDSLLFSSLIAAVDPVAVWI
jgi:sodium/hydrogen exchanger-like protein 3